MADNIRVYGAPDPDNRQPAPEQGLRGEQGAADPGREDLTHMVTTTTGEPIAVEEQSGAAFAEATGRAGGSDQDDTSESAQDEEREDRQAAAMEEAQEDAAEERKKGGYQ